MADYPTPDEIEPVKFDPIGQGIQLANNFAKDLSQIPVEPLSFIGKNLQVLTLQHKAAHQSLINLLRAKNFVDEGGLEALLDQVDLKQQR